MADQSPIIERWQALPRADRAAVLARLNAEQRAGLMTVIADQHDAGLRDAREAPDGWSMFSAGMREVLKAVEASPGQPLPAFGLKPAAAALLLETANAMRLEAKAGQGPMSALHRWWTDWRKGVGL